MGESNWDWSKEEEEEEEQEERKSRVIQESQIYAGWICGYVYVYKYMYVNMSTTSVVAVVARR